jgi:hypothetical protein
MAADDQSEEQEGAGNEGWHEIEYLVGAQKLAWRWCSG